MASYMIAGTGHRPNKLGGYNSIATTKLINLAKDYLTSEIRPWSDRDLAIITGMALGWDQALAIAAYSLGVPFIAAVPFVGQEKRWPEADQIMYKDLLTKAARVEIITAGGFSTEAMYVRNMWMVDRADSLVALWNGDKEGGTYHCIRYAKSKNKRIENLWSLWRNSYVSS